MIEKPWNIFNQVNFNNSIKFLKWKLTKLLKMSLFFVVTPYNLTVPLWSYRSLHFSGRFSVLFYNKLLLLSKIFKNQNRLRFHCNAKLHYSINSFHAIFDRTSFRKKNYTLFKCNSKMLIKFHIYYWMSSSFQFN